MEDWVAAPSPVFLALVGADERDGTLRSLAAGSRARSGSGRGGLGRPRAVPQELEAIDRLRRTLVTTIRGAGITEPGTAPESRTRSAVLPRFRPADSLAFSRGSTAWSGWFRSSMSSAA